MECLELSSSKPLRSVAINIQDDHVIQCPNGDLFVQERRDLDRTRPQQADGQSWEKGSLQ